jgi:hypothetical protein
MKPSTLETPFNVESTDLLHWTKISSSRIRQLFDPHWGQEGDYKISIFARGLSPTIIVEHVSPQGKISMWVHNDDILTTWRNSTETYHRVVYSAARELFVKKLSRR